MDIDDKYRYDEKDGEKGKGDRLVCVVYVEYNQTHYLNVNIALNLTGHAELIDYDNEFNPASWSLHVSKEAIPEFSSIMFISTLLISTVFVITVVRKRKYPSG